MRIPNLQNLLIQYTPAVTSGLLLGLSYPAYPYVRLEWLAWFWMVPLLLDLKEVRAFGPFMRRVLVATFIVSAVGMSWLLWASAWGGWLLFCLGALVFAVPFTGFYLVRRTLGWRAALLGAPFVWTAWDWLYHLSEGSFGWLPLGMTQAKLWWLVQYAELTGVWGVTFWLVAFNALIASCVQSIRTEFAIRRVAVAVVAMLVGPLAYTGYAFLRAENKTGEDISVLLVQPNLSPWRGGDARTRMADLGRSTALTDAAIRQQKPDLMIWPEGVVPYELARESEAREFLHRRIARWNAPLLTGTFDSREHPNRDARPEWLKFQGRDSEVFNAAMMLTPEPGENGRPRVTQSAAYHKRVLMPFAERVPFSDRFPALSKLAVDFGSSNLYSAGEQARTFTFNNQQGRPVTIAAAICYEQLYPARMAEFVRAGAQMLAVISNEGWFARSHGQYQIAAFTQLRAIELRRAVVRAANTGQTCFIDAFGRMHGEAPWWSAQTLPGRASLSTELSFYVLHPDLWAKLCLGVALGLVVISGMKMLLIRLRAVRQQASTPALQKPSGIVP